MFFKRDGKARRAAGKGREEGSGGKESFKSSLLWCFMPLECAFKRLPGSVIVGNGEETNSG